MKKRIFLDLISFILIVLFIYTALSKWFLYDIYLYDLNRSPELEPYAKFISFFVPGIELLIAFMLLFANTRLYGLYGSFALMTVFTIYVFYVTQFTTNLPCTCGGIIRDLTWRNHLILNIGLTILSGLGMIFQKQIHRNQNNQSITRYVPGDAVV